MRFGWKALLGVLVTAVLLWWVLKDVPLTEVWSAILAGDPILLLIAVAIATFGFVIRALRWKVLLAPMKPDTRLRSRFAAVSIGFMGNNILPLRMGEFARALALSRTEPVSASGALGTLVVERALDGIVLFAMLAVTVSLPVFPAEGVLDGTKEGVALTWVIRAIGLVVIGMICLVIWPRRFVRLAERILTLLPGGFGRPLISALEAFLESLTILRKPRLLAAAVLWTVGLWTWHAFAFHFGMLAFGISIDHGFVAAMFTQAVVGFGVAAPSAPGFLGPFQFAADFALADVYGVEASKSLAFAFGYFFAGWVPITLIGLWYASRLGMSLADVGASERSVEAEVEGSSTAPSGSS